MQKLKNKIKHSSVIGSMYLVVMKLFLTIFQFFLPIKRNQILFCSFSGRQYSDSPLEIYNELKNDPKFKNFKLLWTFTDPDQYPSVPSANKVRIDSIAFWKILLQSKYWISNSSIDRLIPSLNKKHVYINTWHGIPLKHLGPDEANLEFLVKNWFKNVKFDLLFCCSEYDRDIFHHIFPETKNIQILGLPRNKQLMSEYSMDDLLKLKKDLNIDMNKKTILYAPTFREYNDVNGSNNFSVPFSTDFIKKVSEKFNFLVRGHYFVDSFKLDDDPEHKIIDVSSYPNLNDLFQVSDIVISDYSSLIFDFALLKKQIVLYLNDIEEYSKYRGFYLNPKELDLNKAFNEQELSDILMNDKINHNKVDQLNKKFNQHFDYNLNYLKKFILD